MNYYSLNNREHVSSFENAVLKGLAPDRGLYFPSKIEKLPDSFFKEMPNLSREEIALQAIRPYVAGEIPEDHLRKIVAESLNFELPVVALEEGISVLELFHGPTLAFKDVGARFMAGTLGYFIQKGNHGEVTVLVATSGDTGGAVARGFLGVEGINVVLLYPKGKVSGIQEKQLTTLGKNITALEVDGTFDDCQAFVKMAFMDADIRKKRELTSANSINVARWLPQMLYYFLAYRDMLPLNKKLVFSVPSGNFGNICAGLLAMKMGLPIHHFVASNNRNDVVTRFLQTGNYEPGPSVQTISNAMDVGDPSNFVRVLELFESDVSALREQLSSFRFSDEETLEAIREVYNESGYILDPHGAVGYLGLRSFLKAQPGYQGVFLGTAHPVKFPETVENLLGLEIPIPSSLQDLMKREKQVIQISSYEDLKAILLGEL